MWKGGRYAATPILMIKFVFLQFFTKTEFFQKYQITSITKKVRITWLNFECVISTSSFFPPKMFLTNLVQYSQQNAFTKMINANFITAKQAKLLRTHVYPFAGVLDLSTVRTSYVCVSAMMVQTVYLWVVVFSIACLAAPLLGYVIAGGTSRKFI